MLSTTNDQRMGELELLLTPNQLGVTAPAGREPVLTSACQHATKSIHLHGMWHQRPKAPSALAFLAY